MTVHLERPDREEPRTWIDVGLVLGKAVLFGMTLGWACGVLLGAYLRG